MQFVVYHLELPWMISLKSLNGCVGLESFDTLMQEFYQIAQGKGERVQTFVLKLERALQAIKQQHPNAMT